MNDRSDLQPVREAVFWCDWHKGWSGTAVSVRIIEQGSGAGHVLSACLSCRNLHGLRPLAEQTMDEMMGRPR